MALKGAVKGAIGIHIPFEIRANKVLRVSEACDDAGTLKSQPKENDAQQLNSCNAAHDRHVGRLSTRHPSYFWSYLMYVLIFNVCGKSNVAAHHFVQLSFLSLSFHHVII